MTNSNLSTNVGFDIERTCTPTTGSFVTCGTALTVNPTVIIFDNQTTVAVAVSVDGVNTWRTFVSGEALTLDLRSNHGNAPNYTIELGTQFFCKGTGGSGNFSISLVYAQ